MPITPALHQRLRMAIRSGKLRADGLWAFRPASWPRQTHVLGSSTTYAPPARDRWRTYLILRLSIALTCYVPKRQLHRPEVCLRPPSPFPVPSPPRPWFATLTRRQPESKSKSQFSRIALINVCTFSSSSLTPKHGRRSDFFQCASHRRTKSLDRFVKRMFTAREKGERVGGRFLERCGRYP
jgi:hypothetical protein